MDLRRQAREHSRRMRLAALRANVLRKIDQAELAIDLYRDGVIDFAEYQSALDQLQLAATWWERASEQLARKGA